MVSESQNREDTLVYGLVKEALAVALTAGAGATVRLKAIYRF